jgi:hypothetical protein
VDSDHSDCVHIIRQGSGFAAWGPRFYVWEEDAAELLSTAGALAVAGGGPVVPPAVYPMTPLRRTPQR